MLNQKLIVLGTCQVFITALLFSYFNVEIDLPRPQFVNTVLSYLPSISSPTTQNSDLETTPVAKKSENHKPKKLKPSAAEQPKPSLRLMTPSQLQKYDGSTASRGLYLGLLGKIFDVHKGEKHYGPGGGYHFFAGRDATRAFVTGDFSAGGLTDDITGLSPQDLLGIQEWLQFYEKEYVLVGYVIGTYYASSGEPTDKFREAQKLFEMAKSWNKSQKADLEQFPSCNSEWTQGKGGRVWCSNKSGGITRDWVGVPRKLFTPGNGQSRCACVKDFGPPQDVNGRNQNGGDAFSASQGDLDNPNLRLYDNCDPKAVSCNV